MVSKVLTQIKPLISIIIPCKNHAIELRSCLLGLQRMTVQVPFEVIVVDSANDSQVLSVVQDFPKIKLIRSSQNLTAASARNLGVSRAMGDYLAFIDADCIPTSNWLQVAWDALYGGAQMVGGPVSDVMPWHPVASADNILQFADLSIGRPTGQIDLLPGCNLVVRREAFKEVGGFPLVKNIEDGFFSGMIAAHWPEKCKYISEMRVFHKGRANLREFWMHQYQFGYQRGFYGFRITKIQQIFGRFYSVVPLVVLKRLIYIFQRVIKWNRKKLIIYIGLLPLILYGLTGWTIGFNRGCRSAAEAGKNGEI